MSVRLTRRSFLALAALGLAGGGAAAVRALTHDDTGEWNGPARTAALLFDDPEAARVLGERWIERPSPEDDAQRLVELLSQDQPALGRALTAADVPALRRLAGSRVAHDLGAGHFLVVDGWFVSFTESRLAALLAVP